MTDAKNTKTPAETEDAAAPQEAAEPTSAKADDDQTLVRLQALEAENAELRDRLLRAVAEMENLRKRTERDVREAAQYAISGFARDMLGVGDNMRRALEAAGGEGRSDADPAFAALLDGVAMTERELLKALERHGVKRIDPTGQKFDPHLHQAMFEVADASVPQGTVVQLVQAGFTIGERVLRPAMVGVSKGGPKAGTDTSSGDASQVGSTVDRTA